MTIYEKKVIALADMIEAKMIDQFVTFAKEPDIRKKFDIYKDSDKKTKLMIACFVKAKTIVSGVGDEDGE